MKNKLVNHIIKSALIAGIGLSSLAHADDIYKGVRGPTNIQLDSRVSYTENEQNVKMTIGNVILKYWDGDKLGIWGFLNLPYKNISNPSKSAQGLGDVFLGAGPRGRIKELHWISYAGAILPTGDKKSKPSLGNGRTDTKIGLIGTYLRNDKKYELDGIIEKSFTGENDSGVNPPDELYVGMLGGGKITKKLRFATGATALIKSNHDNVVNLKAVFRYILSPKLHFEFALDKGVSGKNIPKSKSVGFYMRNNL